MALVDANIRRTKKTHEERRRKRAIDEFTKI